MNTKFSSRDRSGASTLSTSGVSELGKTLAGQLLPTIEGTESASGHDASTAGLVEAIGYFRRY